MPKRLENTVALITAASSGIGAGHRPCASRRRRHRGARRGRRDRLEQVAETIGDHGGPALGLEADDLQQRDVGVDLVVLLCRRSESDRI
jgi:NADP-dependent 3-hydroxy acid dehydrogenase YdfG